MQTTANKIGKSLRNFPCHLKCDCVSFHSLLVVKVKGLAIAENSSQNSFHHWLSQCFKNHFRLHFVEIACNVARDKNTRKQSEKKNSITYLILVSRIKLLDGGKLLSRFIKVNAIKL